MSYKVVVDEKLEKTLETLFRRDKKVYEYVKKKIEQLAENPQIGKPLKNVLKGKRRVHIGPFVLIYELDEENKTITFLRFEHHDRAYKR